MSQNIIQAVINGKKMQDYAKEIGTSPANLSYMLKDEMMRVVKHPLNQDADMQEILAVRNAFAIRRNPRTWAIALANSLKQTPDATLKPIEHIFRADTIDDAFDIALAHDSISKRDAMILVYNTTLKQLTNV